mgnify:CR=1 FL=1
MSFGSASCHSLVGEFSRIGIAVGEGYEEFNWDETVSGDGISLEGWGELLWAAILKLREFARELCRNHFFDV